MEMSDSEYSNIQLTSKISLFSYRSEPGRCEMELPHRRAGDEINGTARFVE